MPKNRNAVRAAHNRTDAWPCQSSGYESKLFCLLACYIGQREKANSLLWGWDQAEADNIKRERGKLQHTRGAYKSKRGEKGCLCKNVCKKKGFQSRSLTARLVFIRGVRVTQLYPPGVHKVGLRTISMPLGGIWAEAWKKPVTKSERRFHLAHTCTCTPNLGTRVLSIRCIDLFGRQG